MTIDIDGLHAWVRDRLSQLPEELCYHSPAHTLDDVWPAAMRLADASRLDGVERTLVSAAVLFHDIGFLEVRRGHEDVSIRMAQDALPRFGFSAPDVEAVSGMIRATKLPQHPENRLERIVADADLDVLGRDDFFEVNQLLRRELAAAGQQMTPRSWLENQIDFVCRHRYFTPWAKQARDAGKRRNLAHLEAELVALG
jgi:predicted metal-dependent HD superfamily phosphohydrolase